MSIGSYLVIILGLAVVVSSLFQTFFIVEQQSVGLIERLGKFNRTAHAGLNFKIPFIERVSCFLSLRINQLDVEVETKTKDNVFVKTQISVQYRAKNSDAYYKLDDNEQQIRAYVFDVVRAEVPKMALDMVFEAKENIANAVKEELTETMQEFGYEIIKTLVTDIQPDERVKAAMNEINEQQRLRVAAQEKGEADKILKVKAAEAEAESKELQGRGIANQRKAIIEGLRESVASFKETISGTSASEVMALVLTTQYFDTLKEIGASNKSSTILLPHSPSGLQDMSKQLQEAIMTANLATQANE